VKLFKQDEPDNKVKQFDNAIIQKKSDQIIIKEIYLWIILSLKSTFDILLLL
jgi:hypothetical protein